MYVCVFIVRGGERKEEGWGKDLGKSVFRQNFVCVCVNTKLPGRGVYNTTTTSSLGLRRLSDPRQLQQWQSHLDTWNTGTPSCKENFNANIPSTSLSIHSGASEIEIIDSDDDVVNVSDDASP